MSFSARQGIIPSFKQLQTESIDSDLKNSLWNILYTTVFEDVKPVGHNRTAVIVLKKDLWLNFFKRPVDETSEDYYTIIQYVKNFYINAPWNKIYDLIEFFIQKHYVNSEWYISLINQTLEREFSAYRVINNIIAPISNPFEIASVEEALQSGITFTAIEGVNIHLIQALDFLSNKTNPDYRNCIKESVSAVETAARYLTKENTLGNALRKIEAKAFPINTQLKESFSKVYDFTNDKTSGIRHSVMEDFASPDFNIAKYCLVTSSAFINYLISLAIENELI